MLKQSLTMQKPKVLLVDHSCHKTTRSFDFFATLLSNFFDVSFHYYDNAYRCELTKEKASEYEFLFFLEFLPSRYQICVPGAKNIFVPMYDNEWDSNWQWKRIARSGMSVISFSKHLAGHALKHGVKNLLEVQYFPDPAQYKDMQGDPSTLLFWDRGSIPFRVVKSLFEKTAIKKTIVIRHVKDTELHSIISETDLVDYNIAITETSFMPREAYLNLIREAGIIIAPRRKEGIGMAFLEAMAMGKCVVAHNDATMNEYIENGINGFLFDADNPSQLAASGALDLATLRADADNKHLNWLKSIQKIPLFILKTQRFIPTFRYKMQDNLFFLLFLIEGLVMRSKNWIRFNRGR